MFNLFKGINKNKASIEPKTKVQTVLSEAMRLGFIERIRGELIITEYGYVNGCYRTKAGGIGFSANGIMLLLNKKKEDNQHT